MSDEEHHPLGSLEEELRASEARFFNVVQSSPDSIVVIDKTGIIRYVNDSSELLFGRQRVSLIGKEFGFPVLSGDKTEIEILVKSKKTVFAEMRVVEIVWDKKQAFLASLRDISEHTRLENELGSANDELKQFVYAVSHDIKAPLRNVQTIATWMIDDYVDVLDVDAVADLNLMKDNVVRMQRLVDGLLQFTEVGKSEKITTLVSLNDVFCEVLENVSVDMNNSNADVTVEPLPTLVANGIQLVILFQNIISNSIKYSGGREPKICVSASQRDNHWEILVADNGVGIEEQYWTRIFSPFERLHTQAEYDGSGIGLATCKKIVNHHNGQIWVDSAVGTGSTFHVTLPA